VVSQSAKHPDVLASWDNSCLGGENHIDKSNQQDDASDGCQLTLPEHAEKRDRQNQDNDLTHNDSAEKTCTGCESRPLLPVRNAEYLDERTNNHNGAYAQRTP
jgi:hypothetical protein